VTAEERAQPALAAAGDAIERALGRLEPAEVDLAFVHQRILEVARSVLRQRAGIRPLVLPAIITL
jgi:hypothetical protein